MSARESTGSQGMAWPQALALALAVGAVYTLVGIVGSSPIRIDLQRCPSTGEARSRSGPSHARGGRMRDGNEPTRVFS
jgi:hypothetical protein